MTTLRPSTASHDDGLVSVQKATPYKGYAIPAPSMDRSYSTAEVERPRLTIQGEISETSAAIDALVLEIQVLNDRLATVLMPLGPAKPTTAMVPDPAAPAVASLMEINHRLRLAIDALVELRQRVAV